MSVLLRKQYSTIKKEKLSEQAKSVLKSMYDTTDGFKDLKATRKIKPKFEAFYNKLKESKPEAIVGAKAKSKAAPKKSADDFKAARDRRKKQTGVPKDKKAVDKDATRPAISKRGKRVTDGTHYPYKKGNTYYEYRDNRFDKNPSKYPMLEKGGYMAKGGELTEDQQLKLRLELVLDDLKAIKEFIYENGLSEIFQRPTKHSDECWTHFNNIEIACDLNDDESLSWGKFYKEKKAKGGELTEDQQLKLRLELVLDDLKAIKEFIYENGLSETFEKPTKHSDECWTLFNNIEIACDLNNDESLSWGKFYKEKGGYMAKGGRLMSDYGKLIINFEKRDYNVNVDLKTLEVDVNIERADSVDTYGLSNIGVEWNQETWGYMIYPKSEEELIKVLKVLKISFSKNELDKFMSAKKEKGGYMAKGGETKVPNTYIPNRDVQELMIVLKEKSIKLKGSDILDGVYAKNSALGAKPRVSRRSKNSKSSSNAQGVYDAIIEKSKKYTGVETKDLDIVKTSDIQSLLDVGYNEKEILAIYLGADAFVEIKSDTEFAGTYYPDGIFSLNKESIDEQLNRFISAAKNKQYELGLKYPNFNWKAIIKKYDIKNEPVLVERKRNWGDNEEVVNTYEVFVGDKVVLGHQIKTTYYKNGKVDRVYDDSETAIKNYNNINKYQKDRDYKAGFNGGYWGVVSSQKEVIETITKDILSQKGGYVKDLEMFVNRLGGVGYEELDASNIKYAKGGKLSKKDFFKMYEENEDQNMHTENVVLLAENYGTESDIRDAKTILAKHESIGHLPTSLRQERDDLHDKLWSVYIQTRENDGYMADGGELASGFLIDEMKQYLNDKFPYSFGFKVYPIKQGTTFTPDYEASILKGRSLNGLNSKDLDYKKLMFPKYKKLHDINYEVTQGGENTYFEFLLSDTDGDKYYSGTFGFKDQGDVSPDYITKFIAFLMESYGLPFKVNHSVYAKGGYMADGGKIKTLIGKEFRPFPATSSNEYNVEIVDIDFDNVTYKHKDGEVKKAKTSDFIDSYIQVKEKGGMTAYRGEVNTFNYRMLDRLRSDNDYYLGNGNRHEKHLWAGNVDGQIAEMKKLWNELPKDKKPEWLSMDDIENYERKMKGNKMAEGGMMEKGGEAHRLDSIFEDGGEIAEGNLEMAMSNVKAIGHHAQELKSLLNEDTSIEAWVVAKLERAETDLSDVTHYIDGLKGEEVESDTYFGRGGLTKEETLKVAEKYAEALSKSENKKVTVNTRTLEEDSFDLDMDGIEYDGGSYNIYDNGDVKNMAISGSPVYGKATYTVDEILRNQYSGWTKMAKGGYMDKGVGNEDLSKVDSVLWKNIEDNRYNVSALVIKYDEDTELRLLVIENGILLSNWINTKYFEKQPFSEGMYPRKKFNKQKIREEVINLLKENNLDSIKKEGLSSSSLKYLKKYAKGGETNYLKKWRVKGIDMQGRMFKKEITLGRMSDKNDVMYALKRMPDNNISEVTLIEEIKEDGGMMAKGGETNKFKIGDKVKIDYISDYDVHNGKVGKITSLREANYYPNGDESVIEKRTYATITYDDGSTEENVNLYREGSGLVSPIKKVKEQGGMMAKGGRLSRKQKQLDLNKNGKLDSQDFKMLRAGRKNARKK